MKRQPAKSSKDLRDAQKQIEDRLFGMKNKSGRATRKYQEMLEKSYDVTKVFVPKVDNTYDIDKLNTNPAAINPGKSSTTKTATIILCAAFKLGKCTKGDKCKFSHDQKLVEAAKQKYRAPEAAKNTGNTDDADGKNGDIKKQRNYTNIICKFFLQACETKQFGKFWSCPNGSKCIYVHHLPDDYVLDRDRKLMKEQAKEQGGAEMTIEEYIEEMLENLKDNTGSLITKDIFLEWKKQKEIEQTEREEHLTHEKKALLAKGKTDKLTGRELYELEKNKSKYMDTDKSLAADDLVFKFDKMQIVSDNEDEV